MSGLTSYLLSLYALKFCKWASNEESNLTLLENFVTNLLCGLWVLACDKFTPEVNICVKCSCYVREVKMKLTEKPNTGLTVSWNAGGYGPNYLEKGNHSLSLWWTHTFIVFNRLFVGKKILICSSCSLIGKKNFYQRELTSTVSFPWKITRTTWQGFIVPLLLPSIIKRSYSLRRYLNSRFVRFLTWFCRLTGCRLNG